MHLFHFPQTKSSNYFFSVPPCRAHLLYLWLFLPQSSELSVLNSHKSGAGARQCAATMSTEQVMCRYSVQRVSVFTWFAYKQILHHLQVLPEGIMCLQCLVQVWSDEAHSPPVWSHHHREHRARGGSGTEICVAWVKSSRSPVSSEQCWAAVTKITIWKWSPITTWSNLQLMEDLGAAVVTGSSCVHTRCRECGTWESAACHGWYVGSKCFTLSTKNRGRLTRLCAWQHLSLIWRRPLLSRPVRWRCAASVWKCCVRNHQPLRGGLGSLPTATTHTSCPAFGSGDVPSSSRNPSSSPVQSAK